ncbi:MAG: hypothetical protein JWM21_489 [Acidobacteria bacterium]|nr:hypothetical protein [Acidobacteriota bacterium]
MSKKKKSSGFDKQGTPERKQSPWALPMIGLVALAFIVGIIFLKQQGEGTTSEAGSKATPASSTKAQTIEAKPNEAALPPTAIVPPGVATTMEVNKAVMVTAELDFGPRIPSIAQAVTEIERRYQPADGTGRTFAILDAYGEPTPSGKLHISMHVSSEKPGQGSLVFRRTGEVLWNSKITPVPGATPAKNLIIYIGDDAGAGWVVDGSGGVSSVLDSKLRDKPVKVRDFWPDGAEREVTLVYSACGCPVKVMARRVGERTTRTKEMPVIFPDDPTAVQTIARLMGW